MKTENIAKVVSKNNKETYEAVMQALSQKDAEIKRHEQTLLWTFEAIIDNLVTDSEAYKIAMDDFKSKLINNFD